MVYKYTHYYMGNKALSLNSPYIQEARIKLSVDAAANL